MKASRDFWWRKEYKKINNKIISLIADVEKIIDDKNFSDLSAKEQGNRLNTAKQKNAETKILMKELRNISDKRNLVISSVTFTVFAVATIGFALSSKPIKHPDSKDLFIVVAQVIPVFLIASSVNLFRQKITNMKYFSILLGEYIPAVIAEVACLIVIAGGKEYRWTFYTALFAISQLFLSFLISGFFFTTSEL